jgi:hypothetical protein
MAKELKNYSWYLLAIVGIVAVVGIVLMVSGKGSCFGAGSTGISTTTEETLVGEDGEDITGQAIQKAAYCYDNDAKASDPYIVMSSVKYGLTSNKLTTVLDSCKTISGKTYLLEGTCYNGKFVQIQKNCAELNIGKSGADYKCVNGACVNLAKCKLEDKSICNGNKVTNTTTDSCTGKIVKSNIVDCAQSKDFASGTPFVCSTIDYGQGPFAVCTNPCTQSYLKQKCYDDVTVQNIYKNSCSGQEVVDSSYNCNEFYPKELASFYKCTTFDDDVECLATCEEPGAIMNLCMEDSPYYDITPYKCVLSQYYADFYNKEVYLWKPGVMSSCPVGTTCVEGKCK